MKLCNFDVGLEPPAVPDRRTLRDRIAANGDGYRRQAERNLQRAEDKLHLQIFLRQGQSQFRQIVSRLRPGCRTEDTRRSEAADRRAGVDRCAQHRRDRAGRGSGRCAANPGVPVPPDRFHPCRGAQRQAGEYQEGPVPFAVGYEERGGQGARGQRRGQHHGVRARRVVRLQQPGVGHALAGGDAQHRLPGGVRCDAFGAVAGRAGHGQRRAARVRAGAGAGGGGGGHFRSVHGNAPESCQGVVGRTERVSARASQGIAANAESAG